MVKDTKVDEDKKSILGQTEEDVVSETPNGNEEMSGWLYLGSKLEVLLYLRESPNMMHSVLEIAKAVKLKEKTINSVLETFGYLPRVKQEGDEKSQRAGFFRLL